MARYRIRAEVVVDGDQSQWVTLDEDGKPAKRAEDSEFIGTKAEANEEAESRANQYEEAFGRNVISVETEHYGDL